MRGLGDAATTSATSPSEDAGQRRAPRDGRRPEASVDRIGATSPVDTRQNRRMADAGGPSIPDAVVRAGLSLVPGVGGALAELYQLARDMDERRIQQMGSEARDVVMDDERFIERLQENERLRDLLVQAAEAARRTAWQAKRVILGRVVGQAVVDEAQVDESAALVAALVSAGAAACQVPDSDCWRPVEGGRATTTTAPTPPWGCSPPPSSPGSDGPTTHPNPHNRRTYTRLNFSRT